MKTLLYILGYGRSGTTLLDWLLGSHQSIVSVGEIGRLPNEIINNCMPKFCGCGKKLNECNLWATIIDESKEIIKNQDISFSHWNLFLLEHIERFSDDTQVIVDSSGDLERIKKILSSDLSREYKIKILYMTRDARAVIYSASIRGYNRGKWKPSVFRASLSWLYRNTRMLKFVQSLDKNTCLQTNYESLTEHPEITLLNIYSFLNLPEPKFDFNNLTTINHTYAGNYKLRGQTILKIKKDNLWMNKISKKDLALIELITGRLNRHLLSRDVV